MMHRAWSSIVEVPYCFSRSYVKFQCHTALKIIEFDSNWAFPDSNSSLNSPMAMKCCTNLETTKERYSIVFQGHPSNFKVTRDKTSPILTQIGRFRTIGRSQLSNPSDLPCFWYCHFFRFSQISINKIDWNLKEAGSRRVFIHFNLLKRILLQVIGWYRRAVNPWTKFHTEKQQFFSPDECDKTFFIFVITDYALYL